eukprot:6314921-Alexandrium_andersonii.AAC.1
MDDSQIGRVGLKSVYAFLPEYNLGYMCPLQVPPALHWHCFAWLYGILSECPVCNSCQHVAVQLRVGLATTWDLCIQHPRHLHRPADCSSCECVI